ncbi:MAG: M48 family metallopeptidase [Planctomycetes bacterium]|nr:M48 family metallopeptidase [Planctomycetota bacterium]
MAQFEQLMAANKRNSVLLVILFILFICILGGVLGWALLGDWRLAIPSIFLALLVSSISAIIGYYAGPRAVLAMSGARAIAKEDDPQLYNIVEELSLASGLPMPALHIIDTPAMNAFATGRDPQHAHVAVTRGLREKLGRDELQGVLAHELSHVQNFDIRFMTLMAVLVGVVVLVADIGTRAIFYGGRGRSRGRGGGGGGAIQLVIILVALLLAILAPIFAKLIQLAVSRQREYLADASAARMTRYPEGLAQALEALAADTQPMHEASRATAHLFIVQPMMASGRRAGSGEGTSMWSSHPPIQERVSRLRSIGNIEG